MSEVDREVLIEKIQIASGVTNQRWLDGKSLRWLDSCYRLICAGLAEIKNGSLHPVTTDDFGLAYRYGLDALECFVKESDG